MSKFYEDHEHHFQAEITILPLGPKTRTHHPLNGIRWRFVYAKDYENRTPYDPMKDIWPEFIDENGQIISDDVPLMGTLTARMHIVFADAVEAHMRRLTPGTEFYCMEADRICAEGVVTKVWSMD